MSYYPMQEISFSFKDKNQVERATGTLLYPYEVSNIAFVDVPTVHGIVIAFITVNVPIDCYLFHINAKVEPAWFGVAIPHRVAVSPSADQLAHPHIFFHPEPHQAGIDDNQYVNFTTDPRWVAVYRYVAMLGMQLAYSQKHQFLIVPFITQSICTKGVGIFNAEWLNIIMDIQDHLKRKYGLQPGGGIEDLVVSSFSSGLCCSHFFRTGGKDVARYLREVYDFDGAASSCAQFSGSIVPGASVKGWRYDKLRRLEPLFLQTERQQGRIHLPWERWAKCNPPPRPRQIDKKEEDVHALIIQRMFHHALSFSKVG